MEAGSPVDPDVLAGYEVGPWAHQVQQGADHVLGYLGALEGAAGRDETIDMGCLAA